MEDQRVPFHPVTKIFPLMESEEFNDLVEDIHENGQLQPIWRHPDGSILDGRNRYRACLKAGIEPQFQTWNGSGSVVAFVASQNFHRRQLTKGQRAAIAVVIEAELAKEAKERQRTSTGGAAPQLVARLPQADTGKSREAAARAAGVSARYLQDAKRIHRDAPGLFTKLVDNSLTFPQAMKELKRRETQEPQRRQLTESSRVQLHAGTIPMERVESAIPEAAQISIMKMIVEQIKAAEGKEPFLVLTSSGVKVFPDVDEAEDFANEQTDQFVVLQVLWTGGSAAADVAPNQSESERSLRIAVPIWPPPRSEPVQIEVPVQVEEAEPVQIEVPVQVEEAEPVQIEVPVRVEEAEPVQIEVPVQVEEAG